MKIVRHLLDRNVHAKAMPDGFAMRADHREYFPGFRCRLRPRDPFSDNKARISRTPSRPYTATHWTAHMGSVRIRSR